MKLNTLFKIALGGPTIRSAAILAKKRHNILTNRWNSINEHQRIGNTATERIIINPIKNIFTNRNERIDGLVKDLDKKISKRKRQYQTFSRASAT